jgi:hypothetical protein
VPTICEFFTFEHDERPSATSRAIDAASEPFRCGCCRPDCEQLVPFRDHVATLYPTITLCNVAELLLPYVATDGTESMLTSSHLRQPYGQQTS